MEQTCKAQRSSRKKGTLGTSTSKVGSPIEHAFKDHKIRSVVVNDEIWFVSSDVCDALNLIDSRSTIRNLDNSEKNKVKLRTVGGMQECNVVNESGVYALGFHSQKPEAVAFRKWVTNDVLPSLRRSANGEAQANEMGDAYIRVPGPGEFHVSLTMDGHLSIVPDESRIKDYQILELEALAQAFLLIGTLWRKLQLLDSVSAHTGKGSNTRYQLGAAIKQAEHIAASATRTRVEMLGERSTGTLRPAHAPGEADDLPGRPSDI